MRKSISRFAVIAAVLFASAAYAEDQAKPAAPAAAAPAAPAKKKVAKKKPAAKPAAPAAAAPAAAAPAAAAPAAAPAGGAKELVFKDPVGDDNGPGAYVYPTDPVYKKGSFDLTEVKVTDSGDGKLTFAVTVNSDLEDPWAMPQPANFSVQTEFIFIKTGPGGHEKGIPGLNVTFGPDDTWTKAVILSPQPAGRVKAEVKGKAKDIKDDVVIPAEVRGAGRTITGTVDKKLVGEGDISTWGFQVVSQSNEGFPDKTDVLTRKVNEMEGQHRFGGGTDTDCDPHAIDILAGNAVGDPSEVQAQHDQLKYECDADGNAKKPAVLKMVYKK